MSKAAAVNGTAPEADATIAPDASPKRKRPPPSFFDVLVQTISCFGCVMGTGSLRRDRVTIHLPTSKTSLRSIVG